MIFKDLPEQCSVKDIILYETGLILRSGQGWQYRQVSAYAQEKWHPAEC